MRRRLYLFIFASVLLPVGIASAQDYPILDRVAQKGDREIPGLVLSVIGARKKPTPDRAEGGDGAAGNRNPAQRSADADRVHQPSGGSYCQLVEWA